MEDLNHKLWIGALGLGLYCYDPTSKQQLYFDPASSENALPGKVIWRLYQSRDSVYWIGTGRSGNKLIKFYHKPERIQFHPLEGLGVSAFWEDPTNGTLWLGTKRGLVHYSFEQGILKHYDNFPASNIFRIVPDQQGSLWFRFYVQDALGLGRFDLTNEQFILYEHDPTDSTSLSSNQVLDVFVDHKGRLWVGTLKGGLNRFHFQSETFTRYLPKKGSPNGLNANTIANILEDEDGMIWMSGVHLESQPADSNPVSNPVNAVKVKLTRLNPETEGFDGVELSTGLGFLQGLHQDKQGALWD